MSRLAVESQTISIHGGTGGNGGAGRISGGGGGDGEGPKTSLRYDITAESFTLTNNIASTTIGQPRSDFRSVNLGDLIFYDEIDRQNVVNYLPIHRRRTGVIIRHIKVVVGTQRVYRARVFGSQDPMTVVVHDNTKFEQRKAQVLEVQRYRHPLLAQLFGVTCSAGLNALIYHDDMMTISQIQKMHTQSILASRYVDFKMWRHFKAAELYWEETTGNSVDDLPGTAWIRLSTGKLCLDIGDGVKTCREVRGDLLRYPPAEFPSFKLMEDELHAKLLRVLKFDEFYAMVAFSSRRYFGYHLPSSTESITLPSIWISSDRADFKSDQLLAVPFPKHITPNEIYMQPWEGYPLQNEDMPTGWTRVEYQANLNLDSHHLEAYGGIESNVEKWWLSQQAYVHKHLQGVIVADVPLHFITGIRFECILDHQLDGFTLRGTFMTHAPSSKVYLFLLKPQVEVLNGQLTVINPGAEKYYWAFDPAGLDRLTHEIAEDIGLPTPEFTIVPLGSLLKEKETNLIREFHAAKGFDPESQAAAIAMRYPLVDIEAIKRSAQELTEQRSMIGPDADSDEVEDEIYYSLALC